MALRFLTLLLLCQLAGEIIARALGLPIPGPVIGMALLFLAIASRGEAPEGLQTAAGGLLQHLALLFVPAGVGVMTQIRLLSEEWRPVAAALLGSTILTIAVTGLVFRLLSRDRSTSEPQ